MSNHPLRCPYCQSWTVIDDFGNVRCSDCPWHQTPVKLATTATTPKDEPVTVESPCRSDPAIDTVVAMAAALLALCSDRPLSATIAQEFSDYRVTYAVAVGAKCDGGAK